MAAIDPTEEAELNESTKDSSRPRATLKIVRQAEGDEDNEDYMRELLGDSDSGSDDESESDEEANGGPSDPAKSKKARKAAALKQLMESINAASDEEMEDADKAVNGAKANKKGKAKATSDNEEEDDEEDSDDEELELEEYVLCTLDPEKASHSAPCLIISYLHINRTTNNPSTSPLLRMSVSSSRSLALTPSTLLATTLSLTTMATTTTMRSMTPIPTLRMRITICLLMRTSLISMMRRVTTLMGWRTPASLKLIPMRKRHQSLLRPMKRKPRPRERTSVPLMRLRRALLSMMPWPSPSRMARSRSLARSS
jgi:hypothetical protein